MIFENNDNNWNGSKEAIRNCNFAQISLFFLRILRAQTECHVH